MPGKASNPARQTVMERRLYAMQVAEDLLRIRDSFSELSLMLKDYKADQDIRDSGPTFQLAQSILGNIRQFDLPG